MMLKEYRAEIFRVFLAGIRSIQKTCFKEPLLPSRFIIYPLRHRDVNFFSTTGLLCRRHEFSNSISVILKSTLHQFISNGYKNY